VCVAESVDGVVALVDDEDPVLLESVDEPEVEGEAVVDEPLVDPEFVPEADEEDLAGSAAVEPGCVD
jgi:hypothetical protein